MARNISRCHAAKAVCNMSKPEVDRGRSHSAKETAIPALKGLLSDFEGFCCLSNRLRIVSYREAVTPRRQTLCVWSLQANMRTKLIWLKYFGKKCCD